MKSKLQKCGKRRGRRFVQVAILASSAFTLATSALFIPLILSTNSANERIAESIDETENTIDFIVKNDPIATQR